MTPGKPLKKLFTGRWLLSLWLFAWAAFSLPWTHPTSTAHWERVRAPHVNRYSHLHWDHVLNALFYMPAAPLAAALGWPMSVGVGAGVVLSLAAEGSQVFSENRAPDGNDVVANISGAVAGAVGLLMYRRRAQRQPLSLLTSSGAQRG